MPINVRNDIFCFTFKVDGSSMADRVALITCDGEYCTKRHMTPGARDAHFNKK